MRRLTAWVGGIASGVVAYRFWRRRHGAETGADPQAAADADVRADELRTKLAESRAAEPVVEEPPAESEPEPGAEPAPTEAAEPESPAESPEERRRRVHAEGRAAIGEMDSEQSS